MVFYFTGTGNSLFAAKRIVSEGESLINIADAVREERYAYQIPKGENVGLVFPVYFYTVPQIVREFVEKLRLDGAEYVYAIITCGGGISQTGAVLKKLLDKRSIRLNCVHSLLMPDNSMLFYQIPSVEKSRERLQNAEEKLAQIRQSIQNRTESKIGNVTMLSDLVGIGYKLCNKTAKFHADHTCIGCGKCAKICPQGVIEMKNGKPQWTKPDCSKCSACINRCPNHAIQYGNATQKRNRYVNPELQ